MNPNPNSMIKKSTPSKTTPKVATPSPLPFKKGQPKTINDDTIPKECSWVFSIFSKCDEIHGDSQENCNL
jgi:hypothetical protein